MRLPTWITGAAVCGPLLAAPSLQAATCDDGGFVDQIAEAAWINLDVTPAQGTAGIRAALQQAQAAFANQPVRIHLAPGACLWAERFYPEYFAGHSISGHASGYYPRFYPATATYIGSQGGAALRAGAGVRPPGHRPRAAGELPAGGTGSRVLRARTCRCAG